MTTARIEPNARTATGPLTRLALSALSLCVVACGGSSGSGSDSQNTGRELTDPVIPLVGPTGKYSMTPEEANAALGVTPPPLLPPTAQAGQNQWLRLEVPFDIIRNTVIQDDPLLAPFSFLNGNILFTDGAGNHIPCIVLVNGRDRKGNDRSGDAGFPADLNASGRDLNKGKGTLLFVADDGDGVLSTTAAFGGTDTDSDFRADTTDITQIRVSIGEINGFRIDAFYTVTVDDGSNGDLLSPTVFSIQATVPSPVAPLDPSQAGSESDFLLRFSEPMIPTTVGNSTRFDADPFFDGNIPLLPTPPQAPQRPFPPTHLLVRPQGARNLFIPCDVTPLNSNNLSVYTVHPLLDLPENTSLEVTIVDSSANQNPANGALVGPQDLAGNFHFSGPDVVGNFVIGPGRGLVNAPVCPEVLYWLPIGSRGLGAFDLNGRGFTTNTPGANSDDFNKAAIVTKRSNNPVLDFLNTSNGIALRASPPGGVPPLGAHNQFLYKSGLGSYSYGPNDPNTPDWEDPTDPGNPGTPFPGVNEMSSGYETFVRNHKGEVILTGRSLGEVGVVSDAIVGEFLDADIFDTQSIFNSTAFHGTFYWAARSINTGITFDTNSINEAPMPNPPPLRYWLGLSPVDIVVNQNDLTADARVIEGDEVWAGDKNVGDVINGFIGTNIGASYVWLLPNPVGPVLADRAPPHFDTLIGGPSLGPPPQSATLVHSHSVRQQIGNYLYVADIESNQVHALNSNTFRVIDSIPVPGPAGLGISSESRFLYVSSSVENQVSVIGADPNFPDFHQEVARIDVGQGPTSIAVQPDGEDVFVTCPGDDTLSIISTGDLTQRKSIASLINDPADIVLAPRQNGFGFLASVYFGYLSNFGTNEVLIFESGPDGPQGIGCDNILGALPTDGEVEVDLIEPRGLFFDPFVNDAGVLAGGVYVCHRDERGFGLVTNIVFSNQIIPGVLPCNQPPGLFFVPPGFNERNFTIVGQWGDSASSALEGRVPSSVVLSDFRRDRLEVVPANPPNNADRGTAPFGGLNSRHPVRILIPGDPRFPVVPTVEPDKMYVSFDDLDYLQVLDPRQVGVSLNRTMGTGGLNVRKLITYFSQ